MAGTRQRPAAPWRIGVDVGGTFTDMVLVDDTGILSVFKVPSVPSSPADGVIAAVDAAAAHFGMTRGAFLTGCGLFIHGSTVATNTILEGKGAKVGLLVTEGFRDSLEIRRGIRFHQWDHRAAYTPVLVPRSLRLPLGGRIDRDGKELAPLDRAALDSALAAFEAEGVESLAICLINAFANPAHERAAADSIRQRWPKPWLSVSTDIVPIVGEYERSSTAVVNAYIAPRVVTYLRALGTRLKEDGLRHPLMLLQSNGGAVSVDQVASRPVNLVLSGPAAGVGALTFFSAAAGGNLISMEIGGTSCDVALMSGGTVGVTDDLVINQYHVAVPSVDIHSVGAGGGTIAGVDAAGMLYVGPHGAGAQPGPACYGLGGTEPTVTDAHLVLGRLREGSLGSGGVSLDRAKAVAAVETRVAKPLGLSVEAAAAGIVRLLEQKLVHAVEHMSVQRGLDPRRFTLVAAGGAGPLHGSPVGRMIGCRSVYVPRLSGAFCALGMLHSNLRQDFVAVTRPDSIDSMDMAGLAGRFAELEQRARSSLALEGFGGERLRIERGLHLRYRGQQWSLRVAIPADRPPDAASIRAAFEPEYRRQFGHIQPDGVIDVTALRVAGIGLLPPLKPAVPPAAKTAPAARETRRVYIDDKLGWRQTPVYAGADLKPGHRLAGPLVVEEATTTVFVGVGETLEVDATDNFMVRLGAPGDAA
ncbi:MAG: hydantoinase/oxoprolinase family protein [Alphaproteobacteria bacterium]|nr:hydantoinase/oxoprolinase family protein [Alphaproteobacteria bacterium]